jgi:outer membrane protein assembly factor BamB
MSFRAAILFLPSLLPLPPPAGAQADSIAVHCVVFLDSNGDGIRQHGESGLADMRITNGLDVFTTVADGTADLAVDREIYRFATLTIPAGFWPTASFWHWVPVGTAGPDTAEFGLRMRPETAQDPVRWVHITDTHVNVFGSSWRMDEALAQINEVPGALCIFNTGDLVDRGSISEQWQNYVQQVATSDLTMFHVVGNHDTVQTATPLEAYEQWVGPPYYSVDLGGWHLVVWNSEPGSPRQAEWLAADVAASPPALHRALLQHRMSVEVPGSIVTLWRSLGIAHVFSGHWHSYQTTSRPSGIDDYNLSWTIMGPLDRTPRCFNLVTMHANGDVVSDLRRLAVNHRSRVVSPLSQGVARDDVLEVLVQAYDTSSRVAGITATLVGGPIAPSVALFAEGISLWRGTLDLGAVSDGTYWIHTNGLFEDGTPIARVTPLELRREGRLPPALGGDWPMFRKSPSGSSWTAEPLEPPLSLRWTTPVGGMIALASPVVAGGCVYIGCRAETVPEEAGVGAFDARTGAPLWFTSLPGGVALAPAIASGVLIVTALADSVYGLDPATGERLWTVSMPGSRYDLSAPVFEGPLAWVGAEPRLRQIVWATGVVRWSSETLGTPFFPYIYGAPAVGGSSIYLGTFGFGPPANESGLSRFDQAAGAREVWENFGAWRSPVATDDAVYVIGGSGGSPYTPFQFLSRRSLNGTIEWVASPELSQETASPALGPGVLVASGTPVNGAGRIWGFDAATGDSLWTFSVQNSLFDMTPGLRQAKSTSSTPAIADTVVWVGSLDGNLYALGLRGGAKLWSYDLGTPIASSPALSGDWLYVGASDGHLWAFARSDLENPTSVHDTGSAGTLAMHQPRPNPGRGETTLSWELSRDGRARLHIFDVAGRLVRTLVDRELPAGRHSVAWDGRDQRADRVAGGVYFARLEAEGRAFVRKVVWVD